MDKSDGPYLSLVGTYRVDPADAPAFASLAAGSVRSTSGKPGCLYYLAAQDLIEPGVFHLTEGWSDRAALDRHLNSAEFQEMFEKAMTLRILSREIHISESHGRTPLA